MRRRPTVPGTRTIDQPLYSIGKVVARPETDTGSSFEDEMGTGVVPDKNADILSATRKRPFRGRDYIIYKQDVQANPDAAPQYGVTLKPLERAQDYAHWQQDPEEGEPGPPMSVTRRVPRKKQRNEEKELTMARSATYQLVRRVLEEGRGRPRKNPNDPKWQKKTAAGDEGEEMEDLQPDSGREADQHIHVRLKAVTDSSEKGGADVTFDNGKKHFVKQNVAKTVLSALDKMKPDARKQIHDHIAQSHENLMQVHSMLTGKK